MLFVGLLLGLLGVGAVAYPLLRPGRREVAVTPEAQAELLAERDITYGAIRDLDFEVEVGSLSEAESRELQERYKDKAAHLLKELDRASSEGDIEQEIARKRRSRRQVAASGDVEAEIASRRRAAMQGPACPKCGKTTSLGAKFCSGCGASLQTNCPRCRATYQTGDKFCAQCGATLGGETKT